MPEQQPPRRRSFDEVLQDSLTQWTKRFERALEDQRQVIGREARERASEIEQATLDQFEELERLAAEKVAELQQIAVDYRETSERAIAERSAEVDRATREHVDASVGEVATAFNGFADKRVGELEDTLRGRLETFRRVLLEETHRLRDETAEQLNETRAMVTSETRQLEEQAAAAQDEMRRVAAKETAAFDELAHERITELRDLLSNQTELLGDFTRSHESTTAQLAEARAFTTDTMGRLTRLNDAVARHIQENDESAAAAARGLKQASATELNSIQRRAMALDELARKLTADVERQAEKILKAESSTAEGLREFERQLEGRRAEIESLVDTRIAALTEQVKKAEATTLQRIGDLSGRAEATLGEQTRDLEATHAALKNELRDARRSDASAARANEARMTKLVELIAATQVALDQLANRIDALESLGAGPAADGDAPRRYAPAVGPSAPAEIPARAEPRQDAANTPDLREW